MITIIQLGGFRHVIPPQWTYVLNILAAALVMALVLPAPVLAQRYCDQAPGIPGTFACAYVYSKEDAERLTGSVTTAPNSSLVAKDLDFEVIEYTKGTGIQSVGVGSDFACTPYDGVNQGYWVQNPDKVTRLNPEGWQWVRTAPKKRVVSLHLPDAVWSDGASDNGTACTFYAEGRRQKITGDLRVRVWGRLSNRRNTMSINLRGGNVDVSGLYSDLRIYHTSGYSATFAPDAGCGPAKWPTEGFKQAGFPPYAEWCELTIKVR